jgi:hypothetical protein
MTDSQHIHFTTIYSNMRRKKTPWASIREEAQKSRDGSTPRQDMCHYLNKPTCRSIEREEHHSIEQKTHKCELIRSSKREKLQTSECANKTSSKRDHPNQNKNVFKRPSIHQIDWKEKNGMVIHFDQRILIDWINKPNQPSQLNNDRVKRAP